MQKSNLLKRSLLLILLSIIMINTQAQTGLNFQGVARTTSNLVVASQPISIKLSILQGSATGSAEYTETRRVITNAQGLFTAVIGDTGAISTLGSFNNINWKLSPKFLKIEMDPAAGTNFVTMGTTQFQYVPYAQYAKGVDADKIIGIVPVTLGGTGVNSLAGLKTVLSIDKINNTSDTDKPISNLTQTALDLKSNASDVTSSLSLKLNKADTSTLSNRIDLKSNLNSPTFVTPALGTPTSGVATNLTELPLTTGVTGTLPVANGGTGSTTQNFVDLTTNQTILGVKTFSSDISVNGVRIGRGLGSNGQNVAIGADALASGTGTRNTAVGYGAMRQYSGTSYDNNTSIGYFNLPVLTSGNANTSVGAESMMALSTGVANTSVGNQSLINITGSYNVGIGQRAGQTITTGSQNTIIGTNADVAVNNLSNASAIGYGASAATSNTIQLGNTSVTNVKTSGTITADAVTYPKAHGTAGQVLSTTGSGTLAWTTPAAAGPIFKHAQVNQSNSSSTVNSEIEVGGLAFRYNTSTRNIEVKKTTTQEPVWQAYNTSRIEDGVSKTLQRPDIISVSTSAWTGLFNSWGNAPLTISGYYNSYEFELTPYLRGLASDNHSFNIKVLCDGWGVITLRVIYY